MSRSKQTTVGRQERAHKRQQAANKQAEKIIDEAFQRALNRQIVPEPVEEQAD